MPTTETALAYHVAVNVQMLRSRRGWTQERLAEVAGLHKNTVSNTETAKPPPSLRTIAALANALGVEPKELLA